MVRFLEVTSRGRSELIDITSPLQDRVRDSGIHNGVCHLFVPHTTAGITVNEGADPAVRRDMTAFLDRLIPADPAFTHAEGNSDAHIKATLTGTALTLFVTDMKLLLGTWQAVYFCEFDGPRRRKVAVKIVPDP